MNNRLIIPLFLIFTVQLSAQDLDIRVLRSINSSEVLPSDKFFRFVSNSNAYLVISIPVVMGTAGLIKHDDKLFRNACVILAGTALNEVVTTAYEIYNKS